MLYISFLLSCFHLARTSTEAQRQVNLYLREGGFACACVPTNDGGGGGGGVTTQTVNPTRILPT